jgi:hypothetical protein
MAFDATRQQVLLHAGATELPLVPDTLAGAYFADTWAWDGSSWVKVADGGPARAFHAIAHDAARGRRCSSAAWGSPSTTRKA